VNPHVVYRGSNGGDYEVALVESPADQKRYDPCVVMPDYSSAYTLANHLNGHKMAPKKLCRVCHPTVDEPAPKVVLSSGEQMSQAIKAAEERLRGRG
jgi:hypothetical protein